MVTPMWEDCKKLTRIWKMTPCPSLLSWRSLGAFKTLCKLRSIHSTKKSTRTISESSWCSMTFWRSSFWFGSSTTLISARNLSVKSSLMRLLKCQIFACGFLECQKIASSQVRRLCWSQSCGIPCQTLLLTKLLPKRRFNSLVQMWSRILIIS